MLIPAKVLDQLITIDYTESVETGAVKLDGSHHTRSRLFLWLEVIYRYRSPRPC